MKTLITVCLLSCASTAVLAATQEPELAAAVAPEVHEQAPLEVNADKGEKKEVKEAAKAKTDATDKPPVEEYTGQKLDIKKVISIDEAPREEDPYDTNCKVVPMEMLYKDSKDKEHDLEFDEWEYNGCSGN